MVSSDNSIICLVDTIYSILAVVDTICSIIVMVDNGHISGKSMLLLLIVSRIWKPRLGSAVYSQHKNNKTAKNQKYIFALFQFFKFLIYNFICIHFISSANHTHLPSLFCLFVTIHTQKIQKLEYLENETSVLNLWFR